LTALTGLLVVMMFVVAPLQALGIFAFQVSELVLALLLVCGIFIISGSPVAVGAMLLALAMIATGAVLRFHSPSLLDLNLFAGSWFIVGVTMAWAVARAVLLYFTVAVIFAALFTFVGSLVPEAFSGMKVADSPALASQVIYFSFATMTTTGYGDVSPVHPIVRSLCNLEAIFGQLYPATLLARLVTLELEHRDKE
jgi:hypothetical protein